MTLSVKNGGYAFLIRLDLMFSMGYVTCIVSPLGEFYPWVEFAPISGKTYLSVYMFNRDEILPLPLFHPFLEERDETHPGGNSA